MAEPEVVVDAVRSVSTPSEAAAAAGAGLARELVVSFEGGATGRLDMAEPRASAWADVLSAMRDASLPAYVEIDPDSRRISRVLQPVRFRVARLEKSRDGLLVELVISHAPHYLRRANPRFEELRERLERARIAEEEVLVTETVDDHEIVDVRDG